MPTLVSRRAPILMVLMWLAFVSPSLGESGTGWWIHLTTEQQVDVKPIPLPPAKEALSQPGLLVWMDESGNDRWIGLPTSAFPSPGGFSGESTPLAFLSGASRGSGSGNTESGTSLAMLTTPLDQLMSGTVLRAVDEGGIATPMNEAHHRNGRMTIRRTPARGTPQFPKEKLLIRTARNTVLQFEFPEGKEKLIWSELPNLPKNLQGGLPPDRYQLRAMGSGSTVTFWVDGTDQTPPGFPRAKRLEILSPSKPNLLALQIRVESLLGHQDSDGKPQPYLVDALDQLESVPAKSLPKHLAKMKDRAWRQILGLRSSNESQSSLESTGIEVIDWARDRIVQGNWKGATKLLDSPEAAKTERAKALAKLYSAVILSESGQATGDDANQQFQAALRMLGNARPADALLAHNNYGNFLLARAQDLLHNHAFQVATATRAPLTSALSAWHAAQQEYRLSFELASQLKAQQRVAIQANRVRLEVLLGDMLQVLNSTLPEKTQFIKGEEVNRIEVGKKLQRIIDDAATDQTTKALALEMQAHRAYREQRLEDCLQSTEAAIGAYLDAGSLAGVESVQRLMGLVQENKENRKAALNHFLIAHELAELLRARFPEDDIGLTRAGFFARRTYVNERIVELLVQEDRASEALEFADNAKARTLQDILSSRATPTTAEQSNQTSRTKARTLSDILSNWPKDVVALEYYLTSDRAWVFVIRGQGKVAAYPLLDEQGEPLDSRTLVADVQQFLNEINGTATKLMQGAASGRGFDQTWQETMFHFRKRLLPEAVIDELAEGATLVIVPHHVLHYFPYAALVLERDTAKRSSYEMPQPKFLIELPIDICLSPSLASWDLMRQHPGEPIQSVRAVGVSEFATAPPLPGVVQDLAHVQEVFGDQLETLLEGTEATEHNARKMLAKSGMAFFATHGINLADNPLESFLLLNGSKTEDGRLTSWEVFHQSLGADLIVMSACFSGLADRSPLSGDDLFGLERAFLHSGCRNVVSSMWDVYDDTGVELVHELLRQLKSGQTAPASIAIAQRKFLADRRAEGPSDPWIHPYFWAVFKSTGDDTVRFAKMPK